MTTRKQWLDAIDKSLVEWTKQDEDKNYKPKECAICKVYRKEIPNWITRMDDSCGSCIVTQVFGEPCLKQNLKQNNNITYLTNPTAPIDIWDYKRDAKPAVLSLHLLRTIYGGDDV